MSDTFRPHPGIIPGQGGSKNWCFSGTKAAKMTGCRIRRQNPPTINLERGKWTETLPIHWKICVKVLGPFKWVLRGSRRLRSPGGLGAQKLYQTFQSSGLQLAQAPLQIVTSLRRGSYSMGLWAESLIPADLGCSWLVCEYVLPSCQ